MSNDIERSSVGQILVSVWIQPSVRPEMRLVPTKRGWIRRAWWKKKKTWLHSIKKLSQVIVSFLNFVYKSALRLTKTKTMTLTSIRQKYYRFLVQSKNSNKIWLHSFPGQYTLFQSLTCYQSQYYSPDQEAFKDRYYASWKLLTLDAYRMQRGIRALK